MDPKPIERRTGSEQRAEVFGNEERLQFALVARRNASRSSEKVRWEGEERTKKTIPVGVKPEMNDED
uniref:Uncharacterized protein n=1 Tax=Cucumis melo TaxID=3656 RepID=A0A9I9D1N5_CUCME